jgi:hypothetical protein
MSEARAGHRAGFFHARVRRAPACARRFAFVPTSKESQAMPFEKGQSGNPAGRPRGSRGRATMALQDMLARDAESIARTAINLAKHGNIAALRICMDRLLPPRRHEPVTLDLPPLDKVADTVAATSAIVAAVAAGDLTAAEAADLAKVVDVHVQALATAALEARLARLEQSRAH